MLEQDHGIKKSHQKLEQLVDQHAEALFLYALMRVGKQDIAEDLVQDTLLAALKSWESFSGKSSEKTWLIGILRHKIADYYRSIRIRKDTDVEKWRTDYFDRHKHWNVKPVDWQEPPDDILENREFWQVFYKCLHKLSQLMAQAFVLRELEGLNPEEICKHLDISETNLWVRLHRARLQLRQCLEFNWFK